MSQRDTIMGQHAIFTPKIYKLGVHLRYTGAII